MTTVAYALKIGAEKSIYMDPRLYRDVYCPDIEEKRPIARIFVEKSRNKRIFQPEIYHSSVLLEECGTIEEALGAIAQAIDI